MLYLLAVLVGALGVSVVLLRPMLLFPALLVIPPIFDFTLRIGPVAAHPNTLLVLALASGTLIYRIRTGTLRLAPIHVVSGLTVLWIGVGSALHWGPNTPRRVLALGLMYLAFEATLQSVRSPEDARRLRTWVVISGTLAAAAAWVTRGSSPYSGRAVGFFGNPNSLGMFLAGCLPLTLSYLLQVRRGWQRAVLGGAFVLIVYGLWISGSRGGLVGAVAGCALVGTRSLRRALLGGVLLGAVFVGINLVEESTHGLHRVPNALAVAPVVFETSKVWLAYNGFSEASYTAPPWVPPRVLEDFPKTLGARIMIWYQAVLAGASNPLMGIGPGNSLFSGIPFDSKVFANCFNIYLSPLVEGGIPGFLLHLFWLRLIIGYTLQGLRRREPDRFAEGAAGAALAFLAHGMVEDVYLGIYANWLIGLVFGAIVGYAMSLPPRPTLIPRTVPAVDGAPERR